MKIILNIMMRILKNFLKFKFYKRKRVIYNRFIAIKEVLKFKILFIKNILNFKINKNLEIK